MLFAIEDVFGVVAVFVLVGFVFSFGAASVSTMFNLKGLSNLGMKFLGYKELFDITTGNNKNDYGDLIDNVAGNLLGRDKGRK